jgi:hypothetical protein
MRGPTNAEAIAPGYKPPHLTTGVGILTLLVSQVREGRLSTELLARYQRELPSTGTDLHGNVYQWSLFCKGIQTKTPLYWPNTEAG